MILLDVAWRILNLAFMAIPLFVILNIFIPEYLTIIALDRIWVFLIFVAITYAINSFLSMIVLALAFFLDQGKALIHFKWMLLSMLGGELLPITAFPNWLESIAQVSPFKFSIYVPVEWYLGSMTVEVASRNILLGIIWCLVLYVLMKLSWKGALTRFTAVGN